jgi:hypothetical protein
MRHVRFLYFLSGCAILLFLITFIRMESIVRLRLSHLEVEAKAMQRHIDALESRQCVPPDASMFSEPIGDYPPWYGEDASPTKRP